MRIPFAMLILLFCLGVAAPALAQDSSRLENLDEKVVKSQRKETRAAKKLERQQKKLSRKEQKLERRQKKTDRRRNKRSREERKLEREQQRRDTTAPAPTSFVFYRTESAA